MEIRTAQKGVTLGERFVQTARRNWARRCMCDSAGRSFTYGQALVNSIALSGVIKRLSSGQEKGGILLPPSTAAAVSNIAVTLAGKVPVNLSYAASEEPAASAIEQCGIEAVISSRSFLKKLPRFGDLAGPVFLEDIAADIGNAAKARAYLKARFSPADSVVRGGADGDDLAAVIFSSGATGRPKGVMLSHNNILSNIDSLVSAFALRPSDNLCGVLPFFHSFGFTCALWVAILNGVSASYAPDPLDCATVGRLARENRSTVLFVAPSFLSSYIRRVQPDDFATLRAVVAGAAKLKKSLADSFEAKFGIRPQAGYGVTELSPVVALNIEPHQAAGVYRPGSKEGTVGRPIPGVEVKIVEPETGEPLPAGREGLLMVKGPNVMLGYLNQPEQTSEVVKDGWYNTGDIASIDADGFLKITDRLSRFSKIGGEMVPHIGIEEVYLQALGTDEQVVSVPGVPAPGKGEELVVLYIDKAGDPDKLHDIISKSKLPNLWKPKRDSYIKVESIPTLGSGKLGVGQLRKMALSARNAGI